MQRNIIRTSSITDLLGINFYIPEYQRGYRWTKTNVLQLLNDIWEYGENANNKNTFYCLQPVVVRSAVWNDLDGGEVSGFELIDGQQRLTTLHRIITYLRLEEPEIGLNDKDLYSIYYKTRLESKSFLESNKYDDTKPDLYYMSQAYQCIKEWFESGKKGELAFVKQRMHDIILPEQNDNGKAQLPEWSVQVIWYEIKDEDQKSEELFTRLNRGKIPLTSAELIKARFVNADSFKGLSEDDKIKRRTQLVQIWDEIENHLNNPKLWAFISNEKLDSYSNKIEFLFDIITDKTAGEKDPLFSFIKFFKDNETADSLWEKWVEVEEIFRSLVYWYTNKNLYHKIGYLIATGTAIRDLIEIKQNNTKQNFEKEINRLIADGIVDNWDDLSYEKKNDHEKISRVLLLVNVELVRANQNSNEFFPFESYKNNPKSLEHIHAQNIEGISRSKKEEWINWLDSHANILEYLAPDKAEAMAIIEEIKSIKKDNFRYEDFEILSERVLKVLPKESSNEYEDMHSIENLALLGLQANISLSNSVFEVKRRKIIEMDRAGDFIPMATKRVFLKYYASSSAQHYSVWTKEERKAYLEEINQCVNLYKPSTTEENEN